MVKFIAVCIILGILIVYLKSINSEIAMLALIGAGIIILLECFSYLKDSFSFINNLIELSGIDAELYKVIFKTVAIGYLIEFGAGLLDDFGLKSLADKLVLFGKIVILSVALPIFYAIFNVISGLL